jgi:endo-1,4-beta-xylanase
VTNVQSTQFDMVTPGNEMKWDTTEPNPNQFNFGPGDSIVAYAKSHNERVRGHNLVWHSQLAGWVTGLPLGSVKAAMENHITQQVTHYKGQLYAWDVVNEPFDDNNPAQPRQDVFFNAFAQNGGSGISYIADALRTARAADPNVKLYLIDYNIEFAGTKQDAMFNLASSLKSQGVPLDGIGFESHFILGQASNQAALQASMTRFANLGLDVAITELDDRITLPASSANLQQQATEFANVVKACLNVSRCPGVTQWAVGDADSWIPGFFSGQGAATMFDQSYQPKPAFTSALAALGGAASSPPPPPTTTPAATTPPPTTPPPPPGGCSITLTPQTQWQTGYVIQPSSVKNNGTTTTTSWTVRVTLPAGHAITGFWNATESVSGQVVTFHGVSFNSTLAPGASGEFGFQASRPNGNTALPTATCRTP